MSTDDRDQRETDALLAEIRSLEPMPGIDPPWEQMARDIRAACDAVDARRGRGLAARIRGLLRPRYAMVGALAAVSAVAVFVLVGGETSPDTGALTPVASTTADAGTTAQPPFPRGEPLPLRPAAIEELDADELAQLADALRDPRELLTADDEEDDAPLAEGDPLLGPEVVAEAEIPEDDLGGDDTSSYDALIDDLSEADLDRLDAMLSKQQPG